MKLTDDLLSEQAEQALNILDRGSEDADHIFSQRFERKMNRLLRRRRRIPVVRILRRAAVIVLCICLSGFLAAMSVEAVRVRFFEAVTRVFEDWTETSYTSEQLNPEDFVPKEPSYLPEGFRETSRDFIDPLHLHLLYEDNSGNYISYSHDYLDGMTSGYDSEDAEIETVSVYGDDNATFVSEDDRHMLIWVDWNSQYFIVSNLDKNELVKIANSTKK